MEYLYIWLVIHTVWLMKWKNKPAYILGFALSHGLLLLILLYRQSDMEPILRFTHHTSSFSLLLYIWIGLLIFYLINIFRLHTSKK